MRLFKKKRGYKTKEIVITDIEIAYDYLINQKCFFTDSNKILSITLTDTGCKHEKELNHVITNRLFNSIKNDYKNSIEHTNFLFVVEYPELITQGNYLPSSCVVHTHIVLNTSLTETTIENYIRKALSKNVNCFIEDITNRNDKHKYLGYLLKQGSKNYILSDSSYNYKISINESSLIALNRAIL